MDPAPPVFTAPRDLFAGWGGAALDLDAYLARVGHREPARPDIDALTAIQRAQATGIPFENLDIVMGRGVALDLESLQDKLLRRGRGGYCYEANLLLAAALERLGFEVSASLARVRMGEAKLLPTSHAVLRVRLDDGSRWLVDAGFGGNGLLEPMPLTDGAVTRQGAWTFRLDRVDDTDWVLSTARDGRWLDLYSFNREARYPADFAVANHYTSTHPRSPFTGRLIAQRNSTDIRVSVLDRELTVLDAHGAKTRSISTAELSEVLTERVGITLSRDELDQVERAVAGFGT